MRADQLQHGQTVLCPYDGEHVDVLRVEPIKRGATKGRVKVHFKTKGGPGAFTVVPEHPVEEVRTK